MLIGSLTLHCVDLAQELNRFGLSKRGKNEVTLPAITKSLGNATLERSYFFRCKSQLRSAPERGMLRSQQYIKKVLCNFSFRIHFSGLFKAEAQSSKASIWRFSINVKEATYLQMQIERKLHL